MTSRPRPPGVLRRTATAAAAGALALAGAIALPAAPAQADTTAKGDVIANLWEWNWDSIASECTNVLGPANGHEPLVHDGRGERLRDRRHLEVIPAQQLALPE
ncbi:hypothetical protein [Streptomyces sp. NPDC001315]|uniref:hypothetical protein n=1 Tax=Streptomyces sp. NPDC001315 TaxID=3364562 RepID=UPI0036CE24F9